MTAKITWADLSPDQQERAKQMFFEYNSVASIAAKFNIKRTTLQYHATTKDNSWEVERELMRAELFSKWSQTKRSSLVGMQSDLVTIIGRSVKHLANRDDPPTPREAKDATVILESLDKITRLDDGTPTEIQGEKVMKLEDITAIAELVPFKKKENEEEKEQEEIVYIEEKEKKNDKKTD